MLTTFDDFVQSKLYNTNFCNIYQTYLSYFALYFVIVNKSFLSFLELLLVTIATEENDGLRRYLRSTKKYDLETKVLKLEHFR